MKLETKLGTSTSVLILAMLISALIANLRIQEANQLSDTVTRVRLPILDLGRELRYSPMMSVRALESYMLFGADPSAAARFKKERQERLAVADAALAKLLDAESQFNLGRDAGRIHEVASGLAQLRANEDEVEQLNELHTLQGTRDAIDLMNSQLLNLDARYVASLNDFLDSQGALRDTEMIRLNQANKSVLITLWTATLLGAIVGGFISVLLARRITRGLGLVADRANAIASGDLTGAALDVGSSDQIGLLAYAMQQMQNGLGSILRTVAQTAGSLTASAVSMSSAADQIHRRVDQQAQQTQQAATAMQEMSASIAEVSRHTQSAAETARSAAQIAHEGGAIVTQMLAAMHSIATAVNETSSTIGMLGEDSRRISQIVTVIDEIATKTNLLALNAAIEAARAGDHGRGFAVVAGEVRHLAESTAQATGQISDMIQGIQERTRTAIASMASGTVTVEQGVTTTHRAGEALERIIGIAERVDRMIAQIAIAASQQAAAADQSSCSLDSIHSLSNDNLCEMATTTTGIENLRATAAELESQVERFHFNPLQPKSTAEVGGARKPLTHAPRAHPGTYAAWE